MINKIPILSCGLLIILFNARCEAVRTQYDPTQCDPVVSTAFIAYELVPDILSVPPCLLLRGKFNNGAVIYLGNPTSANDARSLPIISWESEPYTYYTLLQVDPDVPTRVNPIEGEMLKWLVVNIRGNNVATGETIAEFVVTPSEYMIGYHRYVYLLFKQPSVLDFEDFPRISNRTYDRRFQFSTVNFAGKYGLGDPVAGTFTVNYFTDPCDSCNAPDMYDYYETKYD